MRPKDAGWQDGSATFRPATLGQEITTPIVYVGIDLAKSVFALHGVDEGGRAALVRPSIRRDQLMEVVAKLPACTIGMEAFSGEYHCARQFVKFGDIVKLMAPKFVTPYRMSGKRQSHDAADAEPCQ
jgi:transposase